MIKIALVDDHKLFAKGLEGILEEQEKLKVCGNFSNGNELIEKLQSGLQLDMILTDLNMPILDGFGVLDACKKSFPHLKVIVLSMYDDEKIFKKCIQKGADAFILKDADPDELVFTIMEVFEGRHVQNFSRVIKQANQDNFFDSFKAKYQLSRREVEIVVLIKTGKLNKEIANELCLSVQTIETHRKNIYLKLQVSSRIELVNKANEMNF
jgi:DNA-binding NarL/FixJ family response regulator